MPFNTFVNEREETQIGIMNSTNEWCTDKLSKLLNEELRISTLSEIKEHFASISSNEAVETANLLELPLVFDCLNDSNTEQVDLACEVLSLCMTNLSIGESTNRYSVSLERALNHPYPAVKSMAISELERWITNDAGILNLCKQKSLLHGTIKSVTDKELAVAVKAMKIVTIIGESEKFVKFLVAQDTLNILQDCMNMNEVVRLRFYEIFIDIVKTSEGHLNLFLSSGLLSRLVEELESKDVLFLMNVLTLLSNLITCKHGYKFLENCNVLDNIFNNADPLFESSCGIGTMKLFGHLAHWEPTETLQKYAPMTNKMFENLNETDLTVVGVALDTISFIGETNAGKLALESLGNKMKETFVFIRNKIVSFPTPLCVRTLNNIETLLGTDDKDERIEEIMKKWFETLDDVPMDFVLKYGKNPFDEIRQAGLSILLPLSKQKWGLIYMKNTAGLIEFLMDRTSETFKDCKQVKYEIVCNLSKAHTVFDQSTLKKFKEFINEGPFYVQTVMEVAVE